MYGQKGSSIALIALTASTALSFFGSSVNGQYTATYVPSATGLPKTSENGQSGTNDCGSGSSQTSNCQNFYLNSVEDFCVWAPPNGGEVATFEREEVAYCTQPGRGTRVIPPGTIQGAHFVKTPHYVQITGVGDFTKIGITPGDPGGELDPHGADGNGNPIGGLMFYNGQQMHEWFSFMSATQFCTRACFDGNRATSLCRHTYDELGCDFNAPGNYAPNVFESCQGNDAQDIMYGYPGLATFQQADTTNGVQVPSAHPAPASYNCQTITGINQSSVGYDAPTPSTSSSSPSSSSSTSSSSSSTSTSTSTSSSSLATVITTTTTGAPIFGTTTTATKQQASEIQQNTNSASLIGLSGHLITSTLAMVVGFIYFL